MESAVIHSGPALFLRPAASVFLPATYEHHRWQEHAFSQEEANRSLLRCWMSIAHHHHDRVLLRRRPMIRTEYDFEHQKEVFYIFARWSVLQ